MEDGGADADDDFAWHMSQLDEASDELALLCRECLDLADRIRSSVSDCSKRLLVLDDGLPAGPTQETREKRMFFTRHEAVVASSRRLAVCALVLQTVGDGDSERPAPRVPGGDGSTG